MPRRPFNIAHQGASKTCPPNTMPAFVEARACGADMIELDVVCTQDGVVVVSHDLQAERHTDGQGAISEMTLAEVERLDAGVRHGARFAGTRIPTLEQTLDWSRSAGVRLCIEVKGDSEASYWRTAEATLRLVQQSAWPESITLTSFSPDCVRQARRYEPRLAWGLDPDEHRRHTGWELVQQVLGCGATFLLHRHDTLTAEIIEQAHAHGFAVWAWTADQPAELLRLIGLDVDGIMTNRPDVLGTLLEGPVKDV